MARRHFGSLRSPWLVVLVVALLGGFALVRFDIAHRRAQFQAEAAIVLRLLSQQAAQHDAILATLAAGARGSADDLAPVDAAARSLQSVYPHLIGVLRRAAGAPWPDRWSVDLPARPALASLLATAERASAASAHDTRRAAMTALDPVTGHYALVLSARGTASRTVGSPGADGPGEVAHALLIDSRRMIDDRAWPFAPGGSIDVQLRTDAQSLSLRDGSSEQPRTFGLTEGFRFAAPISVPSQPFVLTVRRATGPAEWPWGWLLVWAAGCALAGAAVLSSLRARRARRRAEDLVRIGQVARLNSLGELAAGMAHELNQPLAAVLASSQAALRAMPAEPGTAPQPDAGAAADIDADPVLARQAVSLAAREARRAADVLGRLRRLVEPVQGRTTRSLLDPLALTSGVIELLKGEAERRNVQLRLEGRAAPILADPVGLEQILHNLIGNALQAFDRRVETSARDEPARVLVRVEDVGGALQIQVQDNGPGIAATDLPHVFEPFFSRRNGGMGLGLALCETLARAQDGEISVEPAHPGVTFVLSLPRVQR